MNEQYVIYPYNENESAVRRNEILTHVTTWESFAKVTFPLNFILCMGILPACVSMYHVLEPLELELEIVVSYVGIESGSSGIVVSALNIFDIYMTLISP